MDGLFMKYFVLNPSKSDAYGKASRAAMLSYAASIYATNPQLANALCAWVQREEDSIINRS